MSWLRGERSADRTYPTASFSHGKVCGLEKNDTWEKTRERQGDFALELQPKAIETYRLFARKDL